MKRLGPILMRIPFTVFLILTLIGIWRGTKSPQQQTLAAFWEKKQWLEIAALAGNLNRLGKADAQTLCYGMLAARELQQPDRANRFREAWLKQKALNWKMESLAAEFADHSSHRDALHTHRTRLVALLLIALAVFSPVPAPALSRWGSACFSAIGCLVLLL